MILASTIMPMAQVTAQRQREVELRRSLREMRTAIDKFKDAVDQGQIPTTELEPGNEGYPPDLETLVERRVGGERRHRPEAEVPAQDSRSIR